MTAARRVAHVQGPSWAHPWLEDVVTRLPAHGWVPVVISLDGEGELHREMRRRGVSSYALDAGGRRALPRAAVRLARRLADVDIVHAHLFDAEIAATLATAIARRPLVITRHASPGLLDLLPIGSTKRALYRALDAAIARRASAMIAPSALVRAELLSLGARPSRVHTILLGIDVDRVATVERSRSVALRRQVAPPRAFVGLAASRLSSEKHVDVVLRAWARFHAEHPNAVLLIAGDGSEHADLERLAGELGMAGAVKFLGWRKDVADLMAVADVVIHASATESTGLVLLEALALQKPLVTTAVGVVNEYLSHDVHCIVVPHRDEHALALAIRRVAADPDAATAMGRAGRDVVTRRSDIGSMVSDYVAVYDLLT